MSRVIERAPVQAEEDVGSGPFLFQVWIDLNLGQPPSDWWWNSEPQPLRDALAECAETRAAGWVCQVLAEGQNPRPDGRWDNP